MYPLLIEPKEVPLIWGGDALVRRFGKRGDPQTPIGESWECWDENHVVNGDLSGRTIAQLRAAFGHELVGPIDPTRIFPLLTKLIDARQSLSVQVHPDDAYAQRVEHQPFGKTECWYILDAKPGATIVLGWNRETSREEYLARVKDGTLAELLRHVAVHPGDVFYLPAGTLHAIGPGIILFETQQASDLTYRIFDWNRLGPDGKPRQLHVEKAADVLDYRQSRAGAVKPLTYTLDGLARIALVADAHFLMERVQLDDVPRPLALEGMPLAVLALEHPVTCRTEEGVIEIEPYASALIPAHADRVWLHAPGGAGELLTAAPVADPQAFSHRLASAGIAADVTWSFLNQFGAWHA
ncbi:MAG TPA: type I phosphomannose isomerase catalytic subunit [Candidatus Acidoferrales bacterium]|nr:type I phosphomannose isomerase catalytic subunit [Candidatus Acidoferrales bacterium]